MQSIVVIVSDVISHMMKSKVASIFGNKDWIILPRIKKLRKVIFSGGDPLMAKDAELDWLITQLEQIPHIQTLRIHSRLPVVIPNRITETLCQRLLQSRLHIVLVTHINHANEIDEIFAQKNANA